MVIRKPPDIPPLVASNFVDAMRGFFAEENATKRDAIAAHQLKVLQEYQSPRYGCASRTSRRCSSK